MKKLLALVFGFCLLVAAACTRSAPTAGESPSGSRFPVTIEATNGTVRVEKRPEKIVSLSPTATEMLFAVGAGNQVVAADSFSDYPSEAPKTELSGLQPNIEAIAKFQPDLVIYATETGDLGASLSAAGITGLQEDAAANLQDTYDQISDIGRATGHTTEAAALTRRMKQDIQEIVAAVPKPASSGTYYHELDTTYFTVTSKTFVGEIYSLLGLKNIADAADKDGSGYPQLSAEYIVSANPDFIFLADTKCCQQSLDTVAARPGWGEIKAVKNKKVVALDDAVASRWGPRVVDLVRAVSEGIRTPAPVKS